MAKLLKTIDFLNIKIWIVFFFLIRLIGITNAPLEIAHNWRQSFTNMVTRNFMEHGVNFLHPMIDMAGNKTGIVGSEFPLFNYLVYLFSSVFGYEHWHGRLINLAVSSIGLYFFYKLIKAILNSKIAFTATIILAVSIWFSFSRKIMPDTFSVSLMIIGLYYAYLYLKSGRYSRLVLFFIFCTLGMLCKIPALSLFSVLAVVVFIKEIEIKRKVILFSVGAIAFAIASVWYFYWVPHLVDTYRFMLFFPKSLTEGFAEVMTLVPETLERFYFSSFHSFIAFAAFLFGAYFLIRSKNRSLQLGVGIITVIFVLFIFKTGVVFPHHSYYIIPYTPIMAVIAAYAIVKLPSKFLYTILGLIVIEGIANQQDDFFIKDSEKYKLSLDETTNRIIPKDDLIIINGGPSPQDIYFSHRKGWTIDHSLANRPKSIDSLAQLGAKYLIINKTGFNNTIQNREILHEDPHYLIYRLDK